jgi:hypothetical protein
MSKKESSKHLCLFSQSSPFLPYFSIATVATVTFYDIKCHTLLMSFVANWGPFSPNGVFYWSETLFYTSWNLYFIKQDHQIGYSHNWHSKSMTFDVIERNSCNCCYQNNTCLALLSSALTKKVRQNLTGIPAFYEDFYCNNILVLMNPLFFNWKTAKCTNVDF